jgi:hypothetical protein
MCDLYIVGLHSLLIDFVSLLIISFKQKTFSSIKRKEVNLVYKPHSITLKIANGLFIRVKELLWSVTMNKILFKER